MTFDLELAGRRALVTGGTKGVGAAVVETLRNAGVKVVTTARSVPDTPPEGVSYIAEDLATAEGCQTVADAVLDRLGGVDIVVNVVGGSNAPGGGFAALSDSEWEAAINQNLMSARAARPSVAAVDDRTGIGCRHPRNLHPTRVAAARVHDRLCIGQGSAFNLQQEPVEGGYAQGRPCRAGVAGLDRDRGGCKTRRKAREACRD